MSERLKLIESLILPADTVADVGCDHGKVAAFCVQSGIAKHVIASDISAFSLQKARDLIGSASNVSFACCDGIAYECDEAVISGMGGSLVCDILCAAVRLPETLVVSAHTDHEKVRKCLLSLGYGIDKDVPILDKNKFYAVIRAVLGNGRTELSELQLKFGADCAVPSEALRTYLKRLYSAYMCAPEKNAKQLEQVYEAMRLQGM